MTKVNFDPLPKLLVASTLLTTVAATQEKAGSQHGSDTSDLIFPIIIGVLGILGGILLLLVYLKFRLVVSLMFQQV